MAGGLKRLSKRDDEVVEGAMAFTLTKPVDLDLLCEEIGGRQSFVVHGDPAAASEENPVTLWATDIDTNDLKKAVTAHGKAPRTAEEPPAFMAKLDSDEAFTPEELEQAVRYLLKRGSA